MLIGANPTSKTRITTNNAGSVTTFCAVNLTVVEEVEIDPLFITVSKAAAPMAAKAPAIGIVTAYALIISACHGGAKGTEARIPNPLNINKLCTDVRHLSKA